MNAPQQLMWSRTPGSGFAFSDVMLLLHGNGSNGGSVFTDSSSYARSPTAVTGSPTTVTDSGAFGGSSIQFAHDQGLTYTIGGGWLNSATDDFTFEGWLIITNVPNENQGYADGRYESLRVTLAGAKCFTLGASILASQWVTSLPSATTIAGTPTVRAHLAVTRTSTATKLWLNGVGVATGTFSTNFDTVYVGNPNPTGGFRTNEGRWDDFRIVKGHALYTANFTPPTSAFPNF